MQKSGLRQAFGKAGGGCVAALALMAALGGCAGLPVNGPTGHAVEQAGHAPDQPLPFRLVEVQDMAGLPAAPMVPALLRADAPTPPTDLIGPGDVLAVDVYEAGVSLFAGTGARSQASATTVNGTAPAALVSGGAQAERLPPMRVDDGGFIRLPYAGRMHAAGHTAAELAGMIRAALKGMSQDPQVVVLVEQSITNSVIVGGDVIKPGRLVLTTNRESLSDAIALAGGYHGDAKDLAVRVNRKGQFAEYRLADVLANPARDLAVSPGDRIEVVNRPMTFAVMGAPGRVSQLSFASDNFSLAEALAMAGGAQPFLGDAKAIFVFRFVKDADGKDQPVVYHLNMMNPGNFFVAQRFVMRDKDVIYVGNAATNQPAKFLNLLGQMFAPFAAISGAVANAP